MYRHNFKHDTAHRLQGWLTMILFLLYVLKLLGDIEKGFPTTTSFRNEECGCSACEVTGGDPSFLTTHAIILSNQTLN